MFENPNLILRIVREEISVSPILIFRSNSCPSEWLFTEDLPFDEYFDISLFETKSETALDNTVLNPEFVANIERERANRSIEEYILNSLQSSIIDANIPELL